MCLTGCRSDRGKGLCLGVLGAEPGDLNTLSKHSTTEPHPKPQTPCSLHLLMVSLFLVLNIIFSFCGDRGTRPYHMHIPRNLDAQWLKCLKCM